MQSYPYVPLRVGTGNGKKGRLLFVQATTCLFDSTTGRSQSQTKGTTYKETALSLQMRAFVFPIIFLVLEEELKKVGLEEVLASDTFAP